MKEQGLTPVKVGGGRRNRIHGFSERSRLRFLRAIATIDWDANGIASMITLTYPDECLPGSPYHNTMNRHRFFRDAENFLSEELPILWRCEWKKRKSGENLGMLAPHFHLIAFDDAFLTARVVKQIWTQVINAKRNVQVDVQVMEAATMAALYAAKYMSKADSDALLLDNGTYLNTGRPWGMHRAQRIRRFQKASFDFFEEDLCNLAREAAAAIRGAPAADDTRGCTLLGPWADQFMRFLREELLTVRAD